jgi:hypothetical protein
LVQGPVPFELETSALNKRMDYMHVLEKQKSHLYGDLLNGNTICVIL